MGQMFVFDIGRGNSGVDKNSVSNRGIVVVHMCLVFNGVAVVYFSIYSNPSRAMLKIGCWSLAISREGGCRADRRPTHRQPAVVQTPLSGSIAISVRRPMMRPHYLRCEANDL